MPSASTRSVASTSSPAVAEAGDERRAEAGGRTGDEDPPAAPWGAHEAYFPSSILAITLRCTSSGPSASRSERAPT